MMKQVVVFTAVILFASTLAAVAEDAWTPPPQGQDAYDTLRHLYRELLRFKSDPVFLKEHWKAGTPYASFKKMVDGLDRDRAVAMELMKDCNERNVSASFCMPSDLGRLGTAYYLSAGKESEATREWRAKFDTMLQMQSEAALRPVAVQPPEAQSVEGLRAEIDRLEANKKEHARQDNRGDVQRLTKEIREKKTQLNRLLREKSKSPD